MPQVATQLSVDRYLELLAQDSERLATIVEKSDPMARVPTCPEWGLGDLAYHVGAVHRLWTWIARERITERTDDRKSPAISDPDDSELPDWLRAGVGELITVLRDADPATPVWSWAPQHEMAFVQRRMPHETSVHRWDAENAAGQRDATVDTDLAADGISEFLFLATAETYKVDARIGVRTLDTGHEWTAWTTDGVMNWNLGGVEASASIEGNASDVLLALWRRRKLDDPAVTVSGDRDEVERFLALPDLT
jgi:uncharacterized protein (TIGR03083 family)